MKARLTKQEMSAWGTLRAGAYLHMDGAYVRFSPGGHEQLWKQRLQSARREVARISIKMPLNCGILKSPSDFRLDTGGTCIRRDLYGIRWDLFQTRPQRQAWEPLRGY